MTTERDQPGQWVKWDGTPPAMGEGPYWVKIDQGSHEIARWDHVAEWHDGHMCYPSGSVTHYHPTRLDPPPWA